LVLSTKRLVAAAKFLIAATKILFVVPNFVAVTKPFFSVHLFHHFSLRSLLFQLVHHIATYLIIFSKKNAVKQ